MNNPMIKELGQQRRVLYWMDLSQKEVGESFSMLKGTPVSVQYKGIFDGAKVLMEGTNDVSENQHFLHLIDSEGMTMMASTERIDSIAQQCMAIRPSVIGGSARTKISVYIFMIDVM